MRDRYIAQCQCGAVTVCEGDVSNSMPEDMFRELYPGTNIEDSYSNCNYCVNHWGIDLCGCGSGEKVGECTNDYGECRKHIPAQVLGERKKYALWT